MADHDEIRRLAVAAIDSDLAHHSGDVIISADTFYRPVLGLLTEFERLRNAALDAVSDLAAEHHPTWASDDAKANGKDPVGCEICWPEDGSWPCASAMVNDDLREALAHQPPDSFTDDSPSGQVTGGNPPPAPPAMSTGRPSRFRKKPVVIEAMRLDGPHAHDAYLWVESHVGSFDFTAEDEDQPDSGVSIDPEDGRVVIRTLEGDMKADPGDWVIRGVQGEFYPCKPDIFEATYEPAPEGSDG